MSYSTTAASGSKVTIPASRDLTGHTLKFTSSDSSTFDPLTNTNVSFTQNQDGVTFTLPTLKGDVYYRLTSSKDDSNYLINSGVIYAPVAARTSSSNNGGTSSGSAAGTDLWLKFWGANPEALIISGVFARDTDTKAVTSAQVVWPDGGTGNYTAVLSNTYKGAVDSYTVTYNAPNGSTTKVVNQPTLVRDSNGLVTTRPELVVS